MNIYELATAINQKSFTLVAYKQHVERVKSEPESKIRQAKLTTAELDCASVKAEIKSLWNQVLSAVQSKFEGHPNVAYALCFDGKVRKVRLNLEASSCGCWPGRATIKGVTVRGYITGGGDCLDFVLYDSSWAKLGIEKR